MLHAVTVGTTTSPVTQVEVVAVNNAVVNVAGVSSAELMGSINKSVPAMITAKKLSRIIWVVDILSAFRFLTSCLLKTCRVQKEYTILFVLFQWLGVIFCQVLDNAAKMWYTAFWHTVCWTEVLT